MPWVAIPVQPQDEHESNVDAVHVWVHTNRIVAVRTEAFYDWKPDPSFPDMPNTKIGTANGWNVISVTLDSGLELEVDDVGDGDLVTKILGLSIETLRALL